LQLYCAPPKPYYTTSRKASKTAESLSPNTADVSAELDALPVDVLRTRIVAEVEKCVDLDALAGMRQLTAQAVGCYTRGLINHEGS